MTLLEQIQNQLRQFPPEKQGEVLDFVTFLQLRLASEKNVKGVSLRKHPAFGSWKDRKIDPISYQQNLRAEWDRG